MNTLLTVLAIIGALSLSFGLVALAELAEAKWLRDHPEEPEPLTSRPRLGIPDDWDWPKA